MKEFRLNGINISDLFPDIQMNILELFSKVEYFRSDIDCLKYRIIIIDEDERNPEPVEVLNQSVKINEDITALEIQTENILVDGKDLSPLFDIIVKAKYKQAEEREKEKTITPDEEKIS